MSEGNGQGDAGKETFLQAVQLLHQGNARQAATLLEPLHLHKPDDTEVAINLGGAYILQGRYEEALRVLESAIKSAPAKADLWINLAAAHLGPLESSSEAQQARAIAAYEEALSLNPEAPNVHYMLGLIYRSRADNLRAAAHFTRAIEQDPADNDARRMLAAIAAASASSRTQ